MASKMSYIPKFLLPQYGPLWRTATRTGPFARPHNADIGQVLVRYASKTVAPKPTTKATVTKSATKTVAAPKAASTKASSSKAAAAKAFATKTVPTKPTLMKAPTPKAANPKTPTSQPTVKTDSAPKTTVPEPPKTSAAASFSTPKAPRIDPSKSIVLEKPEKFNPPSHGSRLPRSTPKHYGGSLSTEEVQTQKTKDYPGLPPPPNTWAHWFLSSRGVHMCITLGTLTSLAIYTFAAKFNATSTFAHMIPPISEFPSGPFSYIRTCIEVLRLHEEHESAITAEKRRRKVDDVAKRNAYRKAHGMEPASGIEGWTGKSESQTAERVAVSAAPPAAEPTPEPQQAELHINPDGSRKKFWGIF